MTISEKTIQEICAHEQRELGGDYVDLRPTLRRALSVGELRKALDGLDDSLPVSIEIMVDHDGGNWFSESGYAVQAYETDPSVTGVARFQVGAAAPEHLEAFMQEFGE